MPHTFNRTDRIATQLRKEIALLVHAAVRDHEIGRAHV